MCIICSHPVAFYPSYPFSFYNKSWGTAKRTWILSILFLLLCIYQIQTLIVDQKKHSSWAHQNNNVFWMCFLFLTWTWAYFWQDMDRKCTVFIKNEHFLTNCVLHVCWLCTLASFLSFAFTSVSFVFVAPGDFSLTCASGEVPFIERWHLKMTGMKQHSNKKCAQNTFKLISTHFGVHMWHPLGVEKGHLVECFLSGDFDGPALIPNGPDPLDDIHLGSVWHMSIF